MGAVLRAVSELVSAALLALIAISVGGLVLAWLTGYLQLGSQSLERQLVRSQLAALQEASVAAAYVDAAGVLHVYVATGPNPVRIDYVYVNGTLYDSNCSVYYDSVSEGLPGALVPGYTVAEVRCSLPSPSPAEVRIIYGGGVLLAYAYPV